MTTSFSALKHRIRSFALSQMAPKGSVEWVAHRLAACRPISYQDLSPVVDASAAIELWAQHAPDVGFSSRQDTILATLQTHRSQLNGDGRSHIDPFKFRAIEHMINAGKWSLCASFLKSKSNSYVSFSDHALQYLHALPDDKWPDSRNNFLNQIARRGIDANQIKMMTQQIMLVELNLTHKRLLSSRETGVAPDIESVISILPYKEVIGLCEIYARLLNYIDPVWAQEKPWEGVISSAQELCDFFKTFSANSNAFAAAHHLNDVIQSIPSRARRDTLQEIASRQIEVESPAAKSDIRM